MEAFWMVSPQIKGTSFFLSHPNIHSENDLAESTTEFTYYTDNKIIDPSKYNILLIQSNCLVVLNNSEYLVDLTKKYISINQNLFGLIVCDTLP